MRHWIKLYLEILDDPKMGRMPDHLWRKAVELFLLAGKTGDTGALPAVEDISWTLRISQDELEEDLNALAELDVLFQDGSGNWFVTHFAERQDAETTAERQANFRKRHNFVTQKSNETGNDLCNDSSNEPLHREEKEEESDKEKEEESDKEKEGEQTKEFRALLPQILQLYGAEKFPAGSGALVKRMEGICKRHGPIKTLDCARWAFSKPGMTLKKAVSSMETAIENWSERPPERPARKSNRDVIREIVERPSEFYESCAPIVREVLEL